MPSPAATLQERGYLTIEDAAAYLSVSRSRIYQCMNALDARRAGKRVLISRVSLDRLFKSWTPVEPQGQRPLAFAPEHQNRRRPVTKLARAIRANNGALPKGST